MRSGTKALSDPLFRVCVTLLLILGGVGCVRHVVERVDPDLVGNPQRLKEQGVFYALPRTVVTVELPVVRTERRRSPFLHDLEMAAAETRAYLDTTDPSYFEDEQKLRMVRAAVDSPFNSPQYRDIQLRLSRLGVVISQQDQLRFDLADVEIATRTEPDPEQIYFVNVRSSLFTERALQLQFTESGLLTAGKDEIRDQTLDLALKAVETFSEVAGIAGLGKWAIMDLDRNPMMKTLSYANEVIGDIEGIRKRRLELLGGPQASSIRGLERRLEEFDRLERSLVGYFDPRTETTWKGRFEFRPPAHGASEVTLLELSERWGVQTKDDPCLRARPVPDGFQTSHPGAAITLTIDPGTAPNEEATVAQIVDKRAPRLPKHGFPYRIPAQATATIRKGEVELLHLPVQITQMGALAHLPRSTGSLETRYDVTFHPDTGSLKELSIFSVGLEPSSIERLGRAAEKLLSAQDEINEKSAELEEKKPERPTPADLDDDDLVK